MSINSSICSTPASGPGISSSSVNVGLVTTETGPVPGLFDGAIYGMQAFAAYLNSVGGICGRKLVVQVADDDLDASQNQTATQADMNSEFAMVGSFSGVDQGGASVLQSNPGVADVSEAISSQAFNLPNNYSPDPQGIAANLAPFVYFKQKYPSAVTKMAVLSNDQSTQLAETQVLMQGMESLGYQFVYQDLNIPLTETDYSADAQGMKSAGALGLVYISDAPLYADVARAMQQAGLTIPLADYAPNAYDPSFIADAGSAANGSVLYSPSAMYQGEDAGAVPLIATMDKYYEAVSGGLPPNEYGAWSWEDGMLFVEGLNAGGGLTRPDLLKGLASITSFTAGDIQSGANPVAKKPSACYVVIDVQNQKFVRDPVNPSGFDCTGAPDFYTNNG
jgi:ABC-type branched-subunit amino acid transport system substrate-binding protein